MISIKSTHIDKKAGSLRVKGHAVMLEVRTQDRFTIPSLVSCVKD